MTPTVLLTPWQQSDLALLRASNTQEMTEFLGGPERESALLSRHQRYLAPTSGQQMYRVSDVGTGEAVGSIGYWSREWRGEQILETGWAVLASFQGRGYAQTALQALLKEALLAMPGRDIHAFPKVTHLASNALCRNAGFQLLGKCDFEYPKGNWISCHDWCFSAAGVEE